MKLQASIPIFGFLMFSVVQRLATLLKKRLQHTYFPVNFATLSRTPFFTQHSSSGCLWKWHYKNINNGPNQNIAVASTRLMTVIWSDANFALWIQTVINFKWCSVQGVIGLPNGNNKYEKVCVMWATHIIKPNSFGFSLCQISQLQHLILKSFC